MFVVFVIGGDRLSEFVFFFCNMCTCLKVAECRYCCIVCLTNACVGAGEGPHGAAAQDAGEVEEDGGGSSRLVAISDAIIFC